MSTATLTAVTLSAAAPSALPVAPVVRRPAAPRAGLARTTRTARTARPGVGPAPLVLTRRGRRLVRTGLVAAATLVLAVALVLAWVGLAATVAPGASAGDGSAAVVSGAGLGAADVETVEVVVRPGDTLWQLARDHAPDRDPRSVVEDIVRLNELGSAGVQAGAILVVPTS